MCIRDRNGSFGDLSYHGKDPGVPVRRGRAYLCGDLANALIDVIEKAVQISHDTIEMCIRDRGMAAGN